MQRTDDIFCCTWCLLCHCAWLVFFTEKCILCLILWEFLLQIVRNFGSKSDSAIHFLKIHKMASKLVPPDPYIRFS